MLHLYRVRAVLPRRNLQKLSQLPSRLLGTHMEMLRNVGVVAHVDAGKTTTTENMLHLCGSIDHIGRVDSGDTVMDFLPMERERGITIQSAAISMYWKDHRINLIDTPGHVDFTVEVERAVRVLDGAVVIVDAVAGVQAQTRTVWRQVRKQNIPAVAFVNKMDRMGANFNGAVNSLVEKLGMAAVPIQYPLLGEYDAFLGFVDLITMTKYHWDEGSKSATIGEVGGAWAEEGAAAARLAMLESIASADDNFFEEYMTLESEIPVDTIIAGLRRATLSNALVAVACGSSLKSRGVEQVLNSIVAFLPAPSDRPPTLAEDKFAQTVKEVKCTSPEMAALAFKVIKHPSRGILTFVRTYSGTLLAGKALYNSTRAKREKPLQVLEVSADELSMLDQVEAGNVACLVGLKHTRTGDTLVADKGKLKTFQLEGLTVPREVFTLAVEPEKSSQQGDLDAALEILQLEDPSLRVRLDKESGQTLLGGIGELHLEVVCDKLKSTHGVPIETGQTYIAYRETLAQSEPRQRRFVLDRTVGAKHMYAVMEYTLSSSGSGQPSTFSVSSDVKKVLSVDEMYNVEKGLEGALSRGPEGFPIAGIHVDVINVEKTSGGVPGTLLACASALVDKEMRTGERILLEPLMAVEIAVPPEFVGEVLSELSSRRAHIREVLAEEAFHSIQCTVPLADMMGYATTIRSLTQGEGSFSMEFEDYGPK